MKMIFNIDIDVDIRGIEVEGKSVEECREALRNMTLAELEEAGGVVKDINFLEVEGTVTARTLVVKCEDIVYDTESGLIDENSSRELPPSALTLKVDVYENEDVEDVLKAEISVHRSNPNYYDVKELKYTIIGEL